MQLRLPAAVVCLCVSVLAQHRVDSRNVYQRVLCIVPMIGSGTPDDPMRPDYAPLPPSPAAQAAAAVARLAASTSPLAGEGIIAFSYQLSDDGKFALAEFVARSRDVFKPLLADTRPGVKVFIKGQDKRADIEAAFKRVKAGFNLDSLVTVAP
ncbi:MAG TPA: hypothetical protein VNH83_14445 [Bryobacteraceae bacterium]|nr:hypothetical protein [Bryobacteraceae bacterium]